MSVDFHPGYVFNFTWKESELEKLGSYPYWCFDAQLICKEDKEGLFLQDTYWEHDYDFTNGNRYSESKVFTIDQALKRGLLTFVCDLNKVERIRENDLNYYDDKDVFDLTSQNSIEKYYFKRKGAKRSVDKMKEVLNRKIEKYEGEIEYAQNSIRLYKENLADVERGNLDINIW